MKIKPLELPIPACHMRLYLPKRLTNYSLIEYLESNKRENIFVVCAEKENLNK